MSGRDPRHHTRKHTALICLTIRADNHVVRATWDPVHLSALLRSIGVVTEVDLHEGGVFVEVDVQGSTIECFPSSLLLLPARATP